MLADGFDLGMADELALSTVMVLVTVAVHGFGLTLLAKLLRIEAFEESVRHLPAMSLRSLAFTQILVLALFLLHGIEIWLYGFVYVLIGAIEDLSTAVYFSTISYAAIGYTDVHIAPEWPVGRCHRGDQRAVAARLVNRLFRRRGDQAGAPLSRNSTAAINCRTLMSARMLSCPSSKASSSPSRRRMAGSGRCACAG